MPNCIECNDTGVIETGNNDLPCKCSAGDTALFNIAGKENPVSGKEIKKEMYTWKEPTKVWSDRTEDGITWKWCDPDRNMQPHWVHCEGKYVRIFPPFTKGESWWIYAGTEKQEVRGADAERRAFSAGKFFSY